MSDDNQLTPVPGPSDADLFKSAMADPPAPPKPDPVTPPPAEEAPPAQRHLTRDEETGRFIPKSDDQPAAPQPPPAAATPPDPAVDPATGRVPAGEHRKMRE